MSPAFLAYLETRGDLAPTSHECHQHWLSLFEAYCQKRGLRWESCRPQDLEQFRQTLLWQPHGRGKLYSSNTIDQGLRVLRHFFRWAKRGRLIKTDPTASWVLPRPAQPDQPVLGHDQVLALLNLPDLSRPQGLRDQLLLELLYDFSLSIAECRALKLDPVDSNQIQLGERRLDLDSAASAMERYLAHGRPQLLRQPTPCLLLTGRGQPYLTDTGIAFTLHRYGQQLGLVHSLCARTLHRSHRAHRGQLARRHSQAGTRMVD